MSTVAQLIEQLKSPNKDRRYDACEELRVMASIPAEALQALETATHDADHNVAEVARHALEVQTSGPPVQGTASAQASSDGGGSVLAILLGGVAAAATAWMIVMGATSANPDLITTRFGDGIGLFVCGNMLMRPGAFVAGLMGSLIALRRGYSNGAMVLVGLAIGVVIGLTPLLL